MTPTETLTRELSGVSAVIAAARGMVKDGQAVNLQPLEAEMRRLCASIERIPRAEAASLEPRLLALIDELDRLFAVIAERRDSLKSDLKDLTLRDRAASAYGAPVPPKPRQRP